MTQRTKTQKLLTFEHTSRITPLNPPDALALVDNRYIYIAIANYVRIEKNEYFANTIEDNNL